MYVYVNLNALERGENAHEYQYVMESDAASETDSDPVEVEYERLINIE